MRRLKNKPRGYPRIGDEFCGHKIIAVRDCNGWLTCRAEYPGIECTGHYAVVTGSSGGHCCFSGTSLNSQYSRKGV
jgi:hypothetical protein